MSKHLIDRANHVTEQYGGNVIVIIGITANQEVFVISEGSKENLTQLFKQLSESAPRSEKQHEVIMTATQEQIKKFTK